MQYMNTCDYCTYSPCPWIAHGQDSLNDVLEIARNQVLHNAREPNNVLRRRCYQILVRRWRGVLGVGNRVELPECCLIGVHDEFPEDPNDEDATYMGHCDN